MWESQVLVGMCVIDYITCYIIRSYIYGIVVTILLK